MRFLRPLLLLAALLPAAALAADDSDGDGLTDDEEFTYGTDPYDPDTDDDGLSDGDEILNYSTDPLDRDSDGGGLLDGTEVDNGLDPLDGGDDCVWYLDADADGFGDPAVPSYGCSAPAGYVRDGSDCDDTDPTATYSDYFYADRDGDGWGDPSVVEFGCSIVGYVPDPGDCDDTDSSIGPGFWDAPEDGIDQDCDGVDACYVTWYRDADGDGWGDAGSIASTCEPTPGYVDNAADCNDTDASVHPGAEEVPCSGVDADCDGWASTEQYWLPDVDGDGYAYFWDWDWSRLVLACEQPEGMVAFVWWDWDCDDANAAVHPGAEEICGNGVDDNCDWWADEGATYAFDDDGDGYGAWDGEYYCDVPSGTVEDSSDCDDSDAAVNPGATEVCQDGVDQDCNGYDWTVVGWYYVDADYDGYGTGWGEWVESCDMAGYAENADDCDDDDPRAPLLHDCPDPWAGNLLNTGYRSQYLWADLGELMSTECRSVWGGFWAGDSTTHTVSTPRDGVPPGAPTSGAWVNGYLWGYDWCTGGWYSGSFWGSDVRITGSGARTHLTATVDAYDWGIGWGNGEIAIDLTWASTGPASWRDGYEYAYTVDGYVYRYDYSGTGRVGTVSGTIGALTVSGLSGSSGSYRDGTWSIWSY